MTVELTREQLRGLDMSKVIGAFNDLNMSISFSRGNAKIRTGLDNLAHATALVRDMITRLPQSPVSAIPSTVPDQVSGPGQATRPATVQSGGGQSVVAGPSAGFVSIPSAYLYAQPSASGGESGKNLTQPLQQAARPPAQPAGASVASGFSMVSGPARAGDTDSKLSQAAPSGLLGSGLQQKSDEDPSFVVVSTDGQARADCDDASMEAEALAHLLGQDAGKARTADSSDASSGAQALRREEIPLTPSEFSKLESSHDCKADGIEAYIKLLPGKVVIFALNYASMKQATHWVNIKTGKVRISMASRSKWGVSRATDQRYNPGDSTLTASAEHPDRRLPESAARATRPTPSFAASSSLDPTQKDGGK